ncbi:hypothetical protein LCGC14_0705300 [marine sediment metagenome]|uniref:Uncharacterized protein n=1 Tax=marine sediment metagenome TaxID=412755 RepID=A0A0F9R201_9ZZZZ
MKISKGKSNDNSKQFLDFKYYCEDAKLQHHFGKFLD